MPRAEDDFELVLRRCRERLSEISLTVPELDAPGTRRSPPLSLDTLTLDAPAALPARPVPAVSPVAKYAPVIESAPAPVPVRPPLPRVEPVARPAAPPPPATEEHEIFPPPSFVPPKRVFPTPPPKVSAPRGSLSRPRAALAAAAALLVAGLAAYRYSGSTGNAVRIVLEHPADGMALRVERGDILVAEGGELLTMARDGRLLGREPLEAPVAALDWDQGSTWTLDGQTAALIERREGQRPTRYGLNHVPTALFVKDRYLWTADRASRVIRQYLVSRSILGAILQPLDRIDLPGMDIATFAFDPAGDLWVADANRRSLFRFRSTGGVFKAIASAPLSPLIGPSGEIHGLFLEEDGLWLTNNADGAAVLRRIPLSSLDWSPAE
jgi:hypothetical protein